MLNNFPKSSEHLEKSVSIFIYATESLNQVKSKAKKIENILNKLF